MIIKKNDCINDSKHGTINASKINSISVEDWTTSNNQIMGNIQFGPTNSLPFSPNFYPNPNLPKFNNHPSPVPNSPTVVITPELQKHLDDLTVKKLQETKKHSHYFKDVSNLKSIDVYKVLQLFEVTDQALGHAIKKLLVAGGRGAGKSIEKDIQEAIDTLVRCLEIKREMNVNE